MTDAEKILVENLREALKGSQRYVLLTISAAMSLLLLQLATLRQGDAIEPIGLPGLVVSANPSEVRMLLIGFIFILPAIATSANAHANEIAKKILDIDVRNAVLTYPSLATDTDPWIRRGSAFLPVVLVVFSQLLWFLSQTDRDWFDSILWSLMIVMPSIVLTRELRNPVGYISGSPEQTRTT